MARFIYFSFLLYLNLTKNEIIDKIVAQETVATETNCLRGIICQNL